MALPRVVRLSSLTAAGVLAMACGPRDVPPNPDSARRAAGASTTPTSPRASDWDTELGEVLVVPSDSENMVVLLHPDAPDVRASTAIPLVLVSAAGDTTAVRLSVQDSQQCGDAAVARVEGTAPMSWSVGFGGRTARLLPLDSMPSLSAGDSARLAADLSRMASAAAANARSRFTGLPFAVIAAQRLTADDRELLIGHLARRLPQEAAPLEERTLLIAERPASASPGDRFDLAYSRRSDGTEDTVEHFEILAALHGRRGVLLLLARDQLSQTTYELLERTPDGHWRARWSRTLTC